MGFSEMVPGVVKVRRSCVTPDHGRRQDSIDEVRYMVDTIAMELGNYIAKMPGVVVRTYDGITGQSTMDAMCFVMTPEGFRKVVEEIKRGLTLEPDVSLADVCEGIQREEGDDQL